MTQQIPEVTRRDFQEEILEADRPVLVLFQADWCDICREAESILEGIAEEYDETLEVRSVDVEESGRLANDHRIAEVPTLIGFFRGNLLKRLEKSGNSDDIEEFVDYFLDLPRV